MQQVLMVQLKLGKGELVNPFYFCKSSIQIHLPSSMKSCTSGSIQFIWTWTPKLKSRRSLRTDQKFSWRIFLRWAQWFTLLCSARRGPRAGRYHVSCRLGVGWLVWLSTETPSGFTPWRGMGQV